MQDASIREAWGEFLAAHAHLFDDDAKRATMWRRTLRKLEELCAAGRRPSPTSEDVEEKHLAQWVGHQQNNYKN
eukprot:12331-Pleurochrysis_carterae.AAC.1